MTLQTKQILPQGMLVKAENAVFGLFKTHQDSRLLYHNYELAAKLVDSIQEVGNAVDLSPQIMEMLCVAGWFYPTGHLLDYDNPTEAAIKNVIQFLAEENYPKAKTEKIKDFIRLALSLIHI